MEFFSALNGKRVWLSSDRVCVGPPSGEGGDPGRLVNGKMKVFARLLLMSTKNYVLKHDFARNGHFELPQSCQNWRPNIPATNHCLLGFPTQTTSARHMWTHPYSPGKPLTLTFTLPPHTTSENPLKAISKMRLWNYNRNIHVSSLATWPLSLV